MSFEVCVKLRHLHPPSPQEPQRLINSAPNKHAPDQSASLGHASGRKGKGEAKEGEGRGEAREEKLDEGEARLEPE